MSFLLIIAMAGGAANEFAKPMAPPPPSAAYDDGEQTELQTWTEPPTPGPYRAATPIGSIGRWVSPNDYPSGALREEREGVTKFLLSVSKFGIVTQCKVTESSGHEDLDQMTCNSIAYKARFWPATDAKGDPAEGSYSNQVRWAIPKDDYEDDFEEASASASAEDIFPASYYPTFISKEYPNPPRMRGYFEWDFPSADSYPASAYKEKRGGETEIGIDISDSGLVTRCNVIKSSGHADLDAAACNYVTGRATFEPAFDIEGKPTPGRVTTGVAWVVPPDISPGNLPLPRSTAEGADLPRENPFQYTGAMLAEISIDEKGKLGSCKILPSSNEGFWKGVAKIETEVCRSNSDFLGRLSPVKDTDGNPVARKVIIKFSLEHGEFEAAAPKTASAASKSREAIPHNNAALWITPDDYPKPRSKKPEEGKVSYILTVGPDGRATKCDIFESSGTDSLDQATCRSAIRRARFKPAFDEKGHPIIGSWGGSYEWKIP